VAFTTKQSHDKTNGHCEELHPDSSVAFTTWQSYDKPLEILISDTIGFIADLPPKLIAAFQSTLDDSIHSDLLLHIIDASDPDMEHKIKVVDDILKDL